MEGLQMNTRRSLRPQDFTETRMAFNLLAT